MWSWLWFFTVPWVPTMATYEQPEVWGWHTDRWTPIVEEALEDYGLESELDTFMRVMFCESRGDPLAHNTDVYSNPKDQASGLMQHMPRWWDYRASNAGFEGYSPFNPIANIYASVWLLALPDIGGWKHWECY